MAKKKGPEMYEGKPVLVAANSDKLVEAVEQFKIEYPDIPLEVPYAVRVKGKKIKQEAFKGDLTIGAAILHDNVEEIGMCAFSGCSGLMSVVMPASMKKIGHEAFGFCSGLTSIEIPDSVKDICGHAFWGCTGLTSIFIPASVFDIQLYAFEGCSGLTSIKVAEDNTEYDSRNDCNAIIATNKNKLICGCMSTIIPDSVTEIGSKAFVDCTGLKSIVIPESVIKIGSEAFEGCDEVEIIKRGQKEMPKELLEKLNGCCIYISTYFPDSDSPEEEEYFDMGLQYTVSGNEITNDYEPFDSYDLTSFDVSEESLALDLCKCLITKARHNCTILEELLDAKVNLYCVIKTPDDDIVDESEVDPISDWI